MTAPKKSANAEAGSPSNGEPVYLAVGYLRRAHGVRGEILLDILTDFPERLQPKEQLFVGDQHLPMTLATRRGHAKGLLVSFEGIQDRDEVGHFRNKYVYVLAEDRPSLPEGEYYHHELLGLQVVNEETGETMGELVDIIKTGANDVYVVKSDSGSEILLPAIPDVIRDIDPDRRQMNIRLLPGLIDEDN